MNYIERCLAGEAFVDEVDDYINAWHSGDPASMGQLHEFLGMTYAEYKRWDEPRTRLPTSENLDKWLFNVVDAKMSQLGVKTSRIDWFETPKSRASYVG